MTPRQQVGADMGLLLPGDLPARRARGTLGHEGRRARRRCGVVSFTVREGSGAALAELDVGVFVQLTGGRRMLHGLDALVQRRAALQHDGPVALTGQQQRRKGPAGPRPQTTGRCVSGRVPFCTEKSVLPPDGRRWAKHPQQAASSPFLLSGHATVYTSLGWPWWASTESLAMPRMAHPAGDAGEAEGFFCSGPGGEGRRIS